MQLNRQGTGKLLPRASWPLIVLLMFCLIIDIHYHFTALGATGRFGPTNNKQYQGTSLEGISVQNGLQTWNVPATGQYDVELCGATGADHNAFYTKGGRGARVQGRVYLEQGTQVTVLVGQQATDGGGGGGTFVVFAGDGRPLAVAGGGGAADIVDGDPGQAGNIGTINAGGPGKGGKVCVSGGSFTSLSGAGGGGGLKTNGRCFVDSSCNKPCPDNDGGKSFSAGGNGWYNKFKNSRCAGGFGGGGNCGGGGGYSGGGVQVNGKSKNMDLHAGGGGSFVPDADWTEVSGDCPEGNGFASFEIVTLDY